MTFIIDDPKVEKLASELAALYKMDVEDLIEFALENYVEKPKFNSATAIDANVLPQGEKAEELNAVSPYRGFIVG